MISIFEYWKGTKTDICSLCASEYGRKLQPMLVVIRQQKIGIRKKDWYKKPALSEYLFPKQKILYMKGESSLE
jgi:hypothetical protein